MAEAGIECPYDDIDTRKRFHRLDVPDSGPAVTDRRVKPRFALRCGERPDRIDNYCSEPPEIRPAATRH
jgi:hypothetical protein